nr:SART-1 family protein DOT2 [Tanacetum cinerariifolium]
MKEERLKKKSDGASDVLSWVSKSRKLEEKRNTEKEKALHFSKMFEEQDNVTQEVDDDEPPARRHTSRDLAGFKVLDGLDKVVEGGAVVLTLKDQNILADGDINQEVDMLENVEIGEQKRRNEAYKAAKKATGVYDDKFNEEAGFEKKMLPQYDDPIMNEGVTLDERGRFSGEAEKKLEELRRRIDGASVTTRFEDLTSTGKVSSDYYTSEEMLKFQKPKKKKSLRKKDKLDLEALEAEARSAGLGSGDRGSRADGKRQAQKEEHERSEAEKRNNAFQSAYMKADEASKALRMEQTLTVQKEVEEEEFVFGDDDDDLHKSLQRARKVALKMKDETPSGPQAIALLASSTSKNADADNGESQDNKVVFTEMEEFVWGLQLDEEAHNPDSEDVFMEEDVAPASSEPEQKVKDSGWSEVKDELHDEQMADEEEEVKPDETIHESSLGKGLSGALQLLKDRGTLKDTVEWGGRNMDKKKSKLVGIVNENDDKKEIRIERTDEYGRIQGWIKWLSPLPLETEVKGSILAPCKAGEAHNPDSEDVFMEEDVAPASSEPEQKVKDSGWSEVKDELHDEQMADEEEEVKPDETIHESSLGKGLSGALQLLKDRGTLKDTVEWGGRNMDKKKSKLVGIVNENDDKKEIRIERTDEYGRILTPKESFRLLSHKFHGKGPGKMKQEKRMRQYHEELKVKQMNNADTPSQSVERMREAQLQTKSPYLVLSGHVKPGLKISWG